MFLFVLLLFIRLFVVAVLRQQNGNSTITATDAVKKFSNWYRCRERWIYCGNFHQTKKTHHYLLIVWVYFSLMANYWRLPTDTIALMLIIGIDGAISMLFSFAVGGGAVGVVARKQKKKKGGARKNKRN